MMVCRKAQFLGQTNALQLARGPLGYFIHGHHATRHLKISQSSSCVLTNSSFCSRSILAQHHCGRHLLTKLGVRYCKRHSLRHSRMIHQHFINFSWRDFFTTTVDYLLETARDKKVAISIKKALIPGPEPAV